MWTWEALYQPERALCLPERILCWPERAPFRLKNFCVCLRGPSYGLTFKWARFGTARQSVGVGGLVLLYEGPLAVCGLSGPSFGAREHPVGVGGPVLL